MAAYLVIGRRRVRFRFLVILAILLGGIGYLILSNQPVTAYASISYGHLDVVHNGLAVIIREETVYTAPVYGKAVYLVADSAAIEAGQPVAVLYKESFEEEIAKQLYDIQEKIVLYQQEQLLDQVIFSDVSSINQELHSLVADVQTLVKDKRFTELAKLETRLRKQLDNKQMLLDLQTEPDAYLTGLYDKEANLVAQMKQWTIDMESPESGLISFNIDGFENILSSSAVDKLSTESYQQIVEQVSIESNQQIDEEQQSVDVQAEQPFYRIVNPHTNWYAVVKYDSNEIYLNRGDTIEAIFDGQDPIPAIVHNIFVDKDHSLIILEFSGHVENMINKRVLPLQIRKTVEGLMVPEGALKKNKGRQGVYIRDREENRFIETSINAEQNGYAIVESVSDNHVLKLHDQVITDSQ